MKFTSKSVIMKRGISHRVQVNLPSQLNQYEMNEDVWDDAIKEFNKKLDKRPHVTMKLGGTKMDVLKVHRMSGAVTLWILVTEDHVRAVENAPFTLKGEVIFAENSDTKVDKMVIEDIMVGEEAGIFSKRS